ncbi:HAMP domain-containing sensor histidine kinase [Deinococcus sp. ZS9-10]|uniref:histidine kinase n=2 Tax=Deinococcus arenicola TaxID=2994950 RepID=A0ABU4DVQ5_9DEIO|nr:HAMP domain-containing sensor histidine kinase [Deinococcus sp. ZS9-10]
MIALTLPIGRSRRAGHDVLISTFNLNGTLATAQLASDVLGVVNPLRAYLRSLAVAVPVSAALAALLSFLLAGRLLKPLERLTRAAAAIGKGGNLRAALPGADRGDEVGRLAGVLQTSFGQVAEVREREETFTYAAAHDLRSPLTAMKTRLQGALSGPRSETELREELTEVLSDLERMRRLSEQLLLLARGERDIVRRPLDLARLAGEAVDRARELAPDLSLEFATSGVAWISGDEGLLSPLLDNLIGNSLRYGGGAAMQMTVTGTPSGVALSMADSGPGVPAAALSHLTTAFYQVGAARSGQGNGLGLAIAQRVAQLHGARLDLALAQPSGLRVTVTFPQATNAD